MGLCTYSVIFQAKVNEFLGDIEGFNSYIYDKLLLGEGSFYQHIDHLRIIFSGLCDVGIKVNAHKASFGLNEIPYLGYIITRGGG